MNEQDILLKQKIEKREKFDTILAYILLVILVGAIALILFLKFTRDEEVKGPEEYIPNYISLNQISNSLNSSLLANRYVNDGASFSSSVLDNAIVITYIKDDKNINLNVPMVGNELVVSINEENKDIITDIYKEIANTICMYYGNLEKYCRSTLNNMGDTGIDGIRIVNENNINNVYITTTRSFAVSNEVVYNDVTKVDVSDKEYVLNLAGLKISNINIVNNSTDMTFSGNIDRVNNNEKNVGVLIKLYDKDGNVLGENKYEYDKKNVLENTGTFEVKFLYTNELRIDNISSYSIEIVK